MHISVVTFVDFRWTLGTFELFEAISALRYDLQEIKRYSFIMGTFEGT